MGFIDDRSGEFWKWFADRLTDRERTVCTIILVAAATLIFVLGGTLNQWQILSAAVLLVAAFAYLLWRKRRKIALLSIAFVLVAAALFGWLYFTATTRRVRKLMSTADYFEKRGDYENSLATLNSAKKILSQSISDRAAGPEAIDCLVHIAKVEINLGQWPEALAQLNECSSLVGNNDLCHHSEVSLWLGEIARLRGDAMLATKYFDGALDESTRCGDRTGEANAWLGKGKAASIGRSPNYDKATLFCEEAEHLYHETANIIGEADAAAAEGDIQHNRGDYGSALRDYLIAQKIYGHGNASLPGQVEVLLKLGDLYSDDAYWDAAKTQYDEASQIAGVIKSRWRWALSEDSLGDWEQNWGSCDAAILHYSQSQSEAEQIHWDWAVATVLVGKGVTEVHQGDFTAAEQDLSRARTLYHTLDISKGEAEAELGMAELALAKNDWQQADADYAEALNLLRSNQELMIEEELQARALRGQGDAKTKLKEYPDAQHNYDVAFTLYGKHGNRQGQAAVLVGQGRLAVLWHNDGKTAGEKYEQAMAIYQDKKIADKRGQAGVCEAEGELLSKTDMELARTKYSEAWQRYQSLGDRRKADELKPLTRRA